MLSVTFLSAETMASDGTRGLSTYLGFLIGPASMNQRYRENERRRACVRRSERGECKRGENERERGTERERESSRWINVFQMGLEKMRGGSILVGQAWLHSVAHINSLLRTHSHTL